MYKSFQKFVLAISVFGQTAMAATPGKSESTVVSNRMTNRAGAYVGILGDPFPTLLGLNVGYNVTDFFRATAGFGRISSSVTVGSSESSASATTLGLGARFFVPGWSLSPVGGLSLAYVAVSGGGVSIQNFSGSGAHVYANIGVDWQSTGGFNAGIGYNISFRSGVGGAPYINLGWYFDILS